MVEGFPVCSTIQKAVGVQLVNKNAGNGGTMVLLGVVVEIFLFLGSLLGSVSNFRLWIELEVLGHYLLNCLMVLCEMRTRDDKLNCNHLVFGVEHNLPLVC